MDQEIVNRSGHWYQFRLGTLTLLMMAAGPILYCAYLFGPTIYYQLFPPEAQPLPSAYFIKDDIQYFSKGPEFKLQTEEQAIRSAQAPDSANE